MKYSAEQIGEIIKKERDRKGWSQVGLGSSVERSDKQISKYEKGLEIPPIKVLLKLCEVFNCELGYLLGEKGYSEGTREDTDIVEETGLNLDAIQSIQRLTGIKKDKTVSLNAKYMPERTARILNMLLSSDSFVYLIDSLFDLDYCIEKANNAFQPIIEKYGEEKLNEVMRLKYSPIDYEHNDNAPPIPADLIEVWKAVNNAEDTQAKYGSVVKPYRFEVKDAIEALVYELYPRQYGEVYAENLIKGKTTRTD